MKKLLFVLTGLFILNLACENNKKFNSSEAGFQYRYIEKSSAEDSVQASDIVGISLKYFFRDSLLFKASNETEEFIFQLPEKRYEADSFEKALWRMQPGDSMHFLINAENFYQDTRKESVPPGIPPDADLKFHIKMLRILKDEEIREQSEKTERRMKAREHLLIQNYLDRENIVFRKHESGIYTARLRDGNGPEAKTGDRLSVHYEGRMINGRLFHSTLESGEPFEFILGDSVVIEAWEKALPGTRRGEKIRLIAPYSLAYGPEGLNKYIPEYATLIFDIKILEIK